MLRLEDQKIYRLKEYLSKAQRISLMAHIKPDGDAVGSSLALFYFLKEQNKDVSIIYPSAIPEHLDFLITDEAKDKILVYNENKEKAQERLKSSDLLVLLDAHSLNRMEDMGLYTQGLSCDKILIDHHLNPNEKEFNLLFSKTDISSTCELLFYVLEQLLEHYNKVQNLSITCATALLCGMTTDTNNFANSVYDSTLEMASKILALGVNRDMILEKLYLSGRKERLDALAYYLGSLVQYTEHGIAYAILSKEAQERFQLKEGETEGFVNMPLSVKDVRMSIMLKEYADGYRVSIRSKKPCSANVFASTYFHGGGHECAAGGRLITGQDDTAISMIDKYINIAIKEFTKND